MRGAHQGEPRVDILRPDQILTLALFLALLGGLWLVVKLKAPGISRLANC